MNRPKLSQGQICRHGEEREMSFRRAPSHSIQTPSTLRAMLTRLHNMRNW